MVQRTRKFAKAELKAVLDELEVMFEGSKPSAMNADDDAPADPDQEEDASGEVSNVLSAQADDPVARQMNGKPALNPDGIGEAGDGEEADENRAPPAKSKAKATKADVKGKAETARPARASRRAPAR